MQLLLLVFVSYRELLGGTEQKLAGIADRSPPSIRGWREGIKRARQSTINQAVASLAQRVEGYLEGVWLRAKAGRVALLQVAGSVKY
jgi:hypothetical protein